MSVSFHIATLATGLLTFTPTGLAPAVQISLRWTHQFRKHSLIGAIYHNGAHAHHIYDYSKLRAPNVLSTIELLKLASLYQPKSIHYISTLDVAFDQDEHYLLESFPSILPPENAVGYHLTKWTSEKILSDAQKKGFPVTLYRPPQIMGHSVTGVSPTDNIHIFLLIKGCIELGIAPYGNFYTTMLPVDFIARFICLSSLEKEVINKVYNLSVSPCPSLTQMFEQLIEQGYDIRLIPYKKWKKEVIKKIKPKNPLFPLLPLYLQENIEEAMELNPLIKTHNFETMLSKLKIPLPNLDRQLLTTYFNFLEHWWGKPTVELTER